MSGPSPPGSPCPRAAGRGVVGWVVLLGLAGAVVLLLDGPGAAGTAAPDAGGTADLDRGATAYAANCTACHGRDGAGAPGTGRTAGPPVDDVDAAYVDQTLRTGRMPLHAPEVGVIAPPEGLPDRDREAVVAWMIAAFDLPDSRPQEPVVGDIARGHELYTQHCAQCHGGTGAGGVSADGTLILPVIGVDEVATVEAIRMGPFRMPRFDEAQLDAQQAADVGVFVASLDDRPTTPLGLFELDRVAAAVLVLPLGAVVLGVVLLVSHPVDLSRSRRTGPPEGHK